MMFKPKYLTLPGAMFALLTFGCSDKTASQGSQASQPEFSPAKTALPVFATHAFDTPISVKRMAFSPNDVASWLGAIALLGENGTLYMSNIEGLPIKAASLTPYKDVIGIERSAEPALFITLGEDGALSAYIETSDSGDFSMLPSSSPPSSYMGFCPGPKSAKDTLYVIGPNGEIGTVALTVDDNMSVRFSPLTALTQTPAKPPLACAHNGEGAVFTFNFDGKNGSLVKITGETSNSRALGSMPAASAATTIRGHSLAFIDQENGAGHIALQSAGAPIANFYDADTLSSEVSLTIKDGLSIKGLERASGIFATQSSYGGSAFDDGVIAFSDTNTKRLVIISRSYLLEEFENNEQP